MRNPRPWPEARQDLLDWMVDILDYADLVDKECPSAKNTPLALLIETLAALVDSATLLLTMPEDPFAKPPQSGVLYELRGLLVSLDTAAVAASDVLDGVKSVAQDRLDTVNSLLESTTWVARAAQVVLPRIAELDARLKEANRDDVK